MNIYQAIMKAADHIESHPQDFSFGETGIPKGCGSPGCALGWIGHFQTEKKVFGYSAVAEHVLCLPKAKRNMHKSEHSEWEFYNRMDDLGHFWTDNPKECARSLRLYAAKYHADGKPATKSDAALVADLMSRVMGAKIPETAPSPELVS